jgi:hypothetical protein
MIRGYQFNYGENMYSPHKGRIAASRAAAPGATTRPVSLFWLTYRHADGRAAGVVVFDASDLIHARLKAALAGADEGLEFVSGHQLHHTSARQVPSEMRGRLLDDGDLRRLQRMLLKKKPPAPSVRRRTAAKA